MRGCVVQTYKPCIPLRFQSYNNGHVPPDKTEINFDSTVNEHGAEISLIRVLSDSRKLIRDNFSFVRLIDENEVIYCFCKTL